jgi:hypothetical protein
VTDREKWQAFLTEQGIEWEMEPDEDDEKPDGLRLLEGNGKVSSFSGLGAFVRFTEGERFRSLALDD